MLFVASFLLLLVSSLFIVSFFQFTSLTKFLLQIYLSIFSLIVFTSQLSGFLGLLSNRWFFLLLQLAETAILFILWSKKGKPEPFPLISKLSIYSIKNLLSSFIKHPFTSLYFLLVTSGYGVLAWLIIRVPPNNSDSMHTHLARVMYWLQQGSFRQLTCSSIFAKIYPFNAQLNILWTILFTKSDKFVGFIQFFSAIVCAISIYGISRLLKGSRRSSLIVSLFFLTFPLIVYEATSTQFDLVVSALFTSSIYFFFDYYKNNNQPSILFSGLAIGLAVGTKETVFMMGPALLIIIIIIYFKERTTKTWLVQWAIVGALSFLLLGSFQYFNNWHNYGNPLGPSEHVIGDSFGSYTFIEKIRFNSPRFFYQFISFDSLPTTLAFNGTELKNFLFKSMDSNLNLGMESINAVKDPNKTLSLDSGPKYNEDESWFGLASVLLLSPAFILGLIFGIRKKDLISLSLVAFGVSFFLFENMLRPGWDPYQGRYFILAVASTTPLAIHIMNKKIMSKIYILIIGIIAMMIFIIAVFSNESKPIIGKKTIENIYAENSKIIAPQGSILSYYQIFLFSNIYYINNNLPFSYPLEFYDDVQLRTFSSKTNHENIVREVEKVVPINGRMGVMLGNGSFDYVFFGPKLERVLININPISLLNDKEWIASQKIPFILIYDHQRLSFLPDYLTLISQVDGWGLYKVDISK